MLLLIYPMDGVTGDTDRRQGVLENVYANKNVKAVAASVSKVLCSILE